MAIIVGKFSLNVPGALWNDKLLQQARQGFEKILQPFSTVITIEERPDTKKNAKRPSTPRLLFGHLETELSVDAALLAGTVITTDTFSVNIAL